MASAENNEGAPSFIAIGDNVATDEESLAMGETAAAAAAADSENLLPTSQQVVRVPSPSLLDMPVTSESIEHAQMLLRMLEEKDKEGATETSKLHQREKQWKSRTNSQGLRPSASDPTLRARPASASPSRRIPSTLGISTGGIGGPKPGGYGSESPVSPTLRKSPHGLMKSASGSAIRAVRNRSHKRRPQSAPAHKVLLRGRGDLHNNRDSFPETKANDGGEEEERERVPSTTTRPVSALARQPLDFVGTLMEGMISRQQHETSLSLFP